MTEKAWAKINTTLEVGKKREDGYHEIKTIMLSVSLCDEVSVEIFKSENTHISVTTNLSYLPNNNKNTAFLAAQKYFSSAGIEDCSTNIFIKKKIPVCAGLAGGSSDAAAVLRAFQRHFSLLTKENLLQIALEIGSDVPYCLVGGHKLCEGRGEIMTELPPMPKCFFVLCTPDVKVSTAEAYKKIDNNKIPLKPFWDEILMGIENGKIDEITPYMFNSFDEVIIDNNFHKIKNTMLSCGALTSVMSGSGSTIFGIFKNEKSANDAFTALKQFYVNTFLATEISF